MILCSLFGHRFKHDGTKAFGTWSRQMFAQGQPASDWYRTLRVPKECERCGHQHDDVFVVPAEWSAKPAATDCGFGRTPTPPTSEGEK